MTRPEGTNQCEYVSEAGNRCERGTLSKLCRKHRNASLLRNDARAVNVSLDEIIEEIGRAAWDAAVETALAKKKAAAA